MEIKYNSRYGQIKKFKTGVPEYWYKGEFIARGSSISSSDYREAPTHKDWEYCISVRKKENKHGTEKNHTPY